jgi:hypothetical protein
MPPPGAAPSAKNARIAATSRMRAKKVRELTDGAAQERFAPSLFEAIWTELGEPSLRLTGRKPTGAASKGAIGFFDGDLR